LGRAEKDEDGGWKPDGSEAIIVRGEEQGEDEEEDHTNEEVDRPDDVPVHITVSIGVMS